jgi:ribosomal protein S18 acetylase RimI-like enzyme
MLLFGGLCIGLVVDVLAGGALVHIWGWLIAIVVVVGFSVFTIHTARRLRSITVTADEVRVGDARLARAIVLGVDPHVHAGAPILGQTMHEGMPRGVAGLTVLLPDDAVVVLPTRHPDRLAAALHLAPATEGVPAVRPAEPRDLSELEDIERRAETLFRVSDIDLPRIPFPVDALHGAKAILVAGRPAVGFIRVDEVDGLAHMQALAVIPGAMRRGIGTALLEAACDWARDAGYRAVTLVTYAEVAWNGPFYLARGFVEDPGSGPGLTELRDWERAVGLDGVGRRVVLRRDL